MLALFQDSLSQAVMITGFVFMMMLVIEYLNILTSGMWQQVFRGSRIKQYLLAGFLGATPGCLGAFAVVALYSHRVLGMGAVVAAMIATSGDESFVMFSMVPRTALLVSLVLFLVGIAAGFLTDLLIKKNKTRPATCQHEFKLHEQDECNCFPKENIFTQWKNCTLARGVLAVVLALFIYGLLINQIGPPDWNWIKFTILIVSAIALFIIATVPDHFLESHLWQHVAKVHVPRIFLWTIAALLLMHLLVDQLQLEGWMRHNQLIVMALAALVGLVPESGPHLIFLTLFADKVIPLSILLTSSIVQDGHGMLPLLAESRHDFIKIKAINFAVGLLVGLTGYFLGW